MSQSVNRKQIALERSRERRAHELQATRESADRIESSSRTNSVAHHQHPSPASLMHTTTASSTQQQQPYLSHLTPLSAADYYNIHKDSSTSPPQSESPLSGGGGQHPQRSPLEFHGEHISFLPPHVIESLKPYYTKTASHLPTAKGTDFTTGHGGRPRPPSFIFAPKYLESNEVPHDPYDQIGVAGPVDPSTLSLKRTQQQQQQQQQEQQFGVGVGTTTSTTTQNAIGPVASSTQTAYDANAPVSYVDISASNAVLQRRVERLEQQLEENLQQKNKLSETIRAMSYAIVPPLAFLPQEFYEKHKPVIDTCSDYAMLYRSALRATPGIGDIHAMDSKVQELSKEHLMDRVVMLTSEVMHLRKMVGDLQKANEMSP